MFSINPHHQPSLDGLRRLERIVQGLDPDEESSGHLDNTNGTFEVGDEFVEVDSFDIFIKLFELMYILSSLLSKGDFFLLLTS